MTDVVSAKRRDDVYHTHQQAPIGGPSIAPTLEVAAPASPGPPLVTPATLVRNNKSGIDASSKPDSQADKNVSGTTIGISIGIGVPVILGAGEQAIFYLIHSHSLGTSPAHPVAAFETLVAHVCKSGMCSRSALM